MSAVIIASNKDQDGARELKRALDELGYPADIILIGRRSEISPARWQYHLVILIVSTAAIRQQGFVDAISDIKLAGSALPTLSVLVQRPYSELERANVELPRGRQA